MMIVDYDSIVSPTQIEHKTLTDVFRISVGPRGLHCWIQKEGFNKPLDFFLSYKSGVDNVRIITK